jgi:hypothetical protein
MNLWGEVDTSAIWSGATQWFVVIDFQKTQDFRVAVLFITWNNIVAAAWK